MNLWVGFNWKVTLWLCKDLSKIVMGIRSIENLQFFLNYQFSKVRTRNKPKNSIGLLFWFLSYMITDLPFKWVCVTRAVINKSIISWSSKAWTPLALQARYASIAALTVSASQPQINAARVLLDLFLLSFLLSCYFVVCFFVALPTGDGRIDINWKPSVQS